MSAAVLGKLLSLLATVVLGWWAARRGWLGKIGPGYDPAHVLSQLAFHLFVPALLFRTMARQDLSALPGRTLLAYFLPALLFALAVYAWQRRQARRAEPDESPTSRAAAPATRTVAAVYGNAVQLGIPLAAAVFGDSGLALHLALVSMHSLVLLTMLTLLAESDLARERHSATRWDTLRSTLRTSLLHPVVLPVVLGLAWNLGGLGLHPVLDEALQGLGSAAVPLCLVLIGVSLATYGVRGGLREAAGISVLKLLVMPAVVLAVAHLGFGLRGMPLGVLVMMAALPVGSNALLFAQRYGVYQGPAMVANVVSSAAFTLTAAFWLAVLAALGALS